jgi:hypothetical protein
VRLTVHKEAQIRGCVEPSAKFERRTKVGKSAIHNLWAIWTIARISHSGHTAGGLIRLSATFAIANATFSLQREISLHAQRFQKPALAEWPAGSAGYCALALNIAEPGLCASVGQASGKLRVAAAVARTLHRQNWNFQ